MELDIIAGVFGKLFKLLAEDPVANQRLSEQVWALTKDYHLEYFLMGCDESLIKLGFGEKDTEGLMQYRN